MLRKKPLLLTVDSIIIWLTNNLVYYYSMLIGYAVKLIAIIVLYLYMYLDNKRRDREAASTETAITAGPEDQDAIEKGMLVSFACYHTLNVQQIFDIATLMGQLTNFVNRTKLSSIIKGSDMSCE